MLLQEISFDQNDREVVGIYRVNKAVGEKLAILAADEALVIAEVDGVQYTDTKYAVTRVWTENGRTYAEFVMAKDDPDMYDEHGWENHWFGLVDADLRNAGFSY